MEKEIYEKAVMEIIEMNLDVRTLVNTSTNGDSNLGFGEGEKRMDMDSDVGW